MARTSTVCLLLAAVLFLVVQARADVFELANGGRIEGALLNPDESPRRSYIVRTFSGGRLTLSGDQVERVVIKSELQRRYEELLPTMPDTLEAHLKMATMCGEAGLKEERDFHFEQVLRFDPDHVDARHALQYSRVDGRWVRQDDWMEKEGFLRHGHDWVLPQELELEKLNKEAEDATINWNKKLGIWRDWIIAGRAKAVDGHREFRTLTDPQAAEALVLLLNRKKEPQPLRLLYIETLGRLQSPLAVNAFGSLAIEDPDARVREACLDALTQFGSKTAVAAFTRRLTDKERPIVHSAAKGLAHLNDPSATLPLIEALITEHTVLVGGGGGIQPTFSDAGSGLNFGGRPKYEEKEFQNEPVLHALTAIHRGVNFGYNEQAWKNWYVDKFTPPSSNLRRSD